MPPRPEAKPLGRPLPSRRRRPVRRPHRLGSDFVHLSHEIRNALNGITGALELLRGGAPPSDREELLALMGESTAMLLALVNNVLDLAKLEEDRLVTTLDTFSPVEAVRAALRAEAPRILAKGLRLDETLSPALPEWVQGDPLRLRQILLNLLGNAHKFTPRGTVAIAVAVAAEEEQRVVLHFSVRDSGIGMSDAVLKQLFRPFVQADPGTAARYGGSGLGLAICRRLAVRMGGRIWAESRPGDGSTFHLQIPFLKVPPHAYDI